jgi:SAM-dependent methyltransferase
LTLHDPEVVRREYASEAGLAGRIAGHQRYGEGPDARELVFVAVAERRPGRVLEVGCGRGELAARLGSELGCAVDAVDQSERMVALARARGVDAVVGDAQSLPFEDGSFDAAVAAWMLFHVPDVERALGELARVLRPGGRLVVATNGRAHLRELFELLGVERRASTFDAEDAEELLARHFARIERRPAHGVLRFPDRAAAQEYVAASVVTLAPAGPLPAFDGPLAVTRAAEIFVAEAAS